LALSAFKKMNSPPSLCTNFHHYVNVIYPSLSPLWPIHLLFILSLCTGHFVPCQGSHFREGHLKNLCISTAFNIYPYILYLHRCYVLQYCWCCITWGVGGKGVRKAMEWAKVKHILSGDILRNPFEHRLKY
jgi:hypothetical protein